MIIEIFLAMVVEMYLFLMAQSMRLLYTMEKSQLARNGTAERPAF